MFYLCQYHRRERFSPSHLLHLIGPPARPVATYRALLAALQEQPEPFTARSCRPNHPSASLSAPPPLRSRGQRYFDPYLAQTMSVTSPERRKLILPAIVLDVRSLECTVTEESVEESVMLPGLYSGRVIIRGNSITMDSRYARLDEYLNNHHLMAALMTLPFAPGGSRSTKRRAADGLRE